MFESHDFANLSADIERLFVDVCVSVGGHCRDCPRRVRIYQGAGVALMRQRVGGKF